MLGKAMRFATVWILAFAICGKAIRYEDAAVSQGTTEDLEHLARMPGRFYRPFLQAVFRRPFLKERQRTLTPFSKTRPFLQDVFSQEINFEDHLSTEDLRLAVIAIAVTSAADAFAPRNVQGVRPVQKDSNTAFAPILTNNPLNPDLATPQVSWHDMKLYANRDVEAFLHESGHRELAVLDPPTPADVEAFKSLNKEKDSKVAWYNESAAPPLDKGFYKPQFNVVQKYAGRLKHAAQVYDLKPEEEAAIYSLTNSDGDIINAIARGASAVRFVDCDSGQGIAGDIQCTLTKEDMLPWLKILQASLKKMPSAAAGRLYRGVGFNVDGSAGSMAPITGFSCFSDDLKIANYFAQGRRKDGIQPTIFVMDEHSSGRLLYPAEILSPDQKAVVFGVGTKFVIEENEQVQQEVEALWQKKLAAGASANWPVPEFKKEDFKNQALPDFKVLLIKEVL